MALEQLKLKVGIAITVAAFVWTIPFENAIAQVNGTSAATSRGTQQTIGSILKNLQSDVGALAKAVSRANTSSARHQQTVTRSVAGVYASVESLEGSLRQLEGKIDQLDNKLDRVRADMAALQVLVSQVGSANSALDNSSKESRSNQPPKPSAKVASITRADSLARAENLIASNNLSEAAQILNKLTQDKSADQADEARFLLGEVLYLQGQHKNAAGTLLLALTKNHQSPRRLQGMLTLALVLEELDQRAQACATFRELLSSDGIDLDPSFRQKAMFAQSKAECR